MQDAILALLSDVSDCADVTDAHLAGIAKLVVSFTTATSIKSGDFAGLTSMTWLQPTGSSYIRSVPEDVFDGCGNLGIVELDQNPGATFTITAELEKEGAGVVVSIDEGAPSSLSVTLSATGGTLSTQTLSRSLAAPWRARPSP